VDVLAAYSLAGIAYDAMGNLKALKRYRQDASLIDDLTYTIATTSNRLTAVADGVVPTTEDWDAEPLTRPRSVTMQTAI